MDKKMFFKFAAICIMAFFLLVPNVYSGPKMEVLKYGFSIGTSPRHEWHPYTDYNPVDDEFMVLFVTSGKRVETDTESFHAINGQRVSSDGELLGDLIQLSPPEPGWKSMPKPAHNQFSNEYMVVFTSGPDLSLSQTYITRIDNDGNIKYGPELLYPSTYRASHTAIAFNSVRQEYLVVYDDKYIFTNDPNIYDQPGFILDEDGNVISGPMLLDNGPGSHFSPYVEYNPIDDTYMLNWEDFRHVPPGMPWFFGPYDIYGSLLAGDGTILVDPVVNVDDTGQPDEGRVQVVPSIVHNSTDNEFLVAWTDRRPSLDEGGVIGRLINADGTPKGPDFIIADGPGSQGTPRMVYVQNMKRYFVVYTSNSDIYARWLNKKAEPVGEEIPMFQGPGTQSLPSVDYSPVMKRFLITWRDDNAPGDYEVIPGGGPMTPEIASDLRGTLYGVPSKK